MTDAGTAIEPLYYFQQRYYGSLHHVQVAQYYAVECWLGERGYSICPPTGETTTDVFGWRKK